MTFRHLLAVIGLSLGCATSALAFDLPPPVDAPEYTGSIAAASGWYIRGDLGYNIAIKSDAPTSRAFNFDIAAPSYTSSEFDNHRFGRDFSLNAGAGYQFNDFLRSDFTVDYFSSTIKGNSPWANCTSVAGTICSFREQDMSALSLLANGYVDLGTYWGMTPYLGAGAGVSYVKWGDVNQAILCTDCDSVNTDLAKSEGADSWRFTYALMTGISYDLTTSMKVDLGYRFSQIAKGDMFEFNEYERAFGASGMKGRDKGLTRHEVRVGLRMTTW